MSTIDTSTWNSDADLNTAIEGIPLNADASIQQTWRAIQMLMAALKGDTSAIKLTINQPDGTTIVATNQTLTVVDNSHAHVIANVTGLQTALDGKAADGDVVHLAGAETVAGAKIFSSKIQGSISGSATDIDIAGDGTDLASERGQIGDLVTLESPVNYNSQTKTGYFYVPYSSQNTNGPHTSGSTLLVFATQDSRITQICKAINQTVLYVRHNYNGTWSTWRQIFEASALGDGLKLTSGKVSVPEYSGATASANGTSGLVPPAASAERMHYLRGDGDWVDLESRLSSVEQRLTSLGG